MKRNIFYSLIALFYSQLLFCQHDIIPVSPNAASLGLYGAIPVGHYTGTPDISLPIYEIDLDGKEIPITLSYHASGIRINQDASWVGLGWSLQAGGAITKEVRGWDDFEQDPIGYYYDNLFPFYDENNMLIPELDNSERCSGYLRGEKDSEPDVFHYNFVGQSGSLFFKKANENPLSLGHVQATLTNPICYLDVKFNPTLKTWKISDGDGFIYYFSTCEITQPYSPNSSPSFTTMPREYFYPREKQKTVISTWFLDSIKSPRGNVVQFNYIQDEEIYTRISKSETIIHHTPNKLKKDYTQSYSTIKQVRLVSIVFNGGKVGFSTSERLDLEPAWGNPQKLDEIRVINSQGDPIKSLKLYSHYDCGLKDLLSSTYNDRRLILDSINEISSDLTEGKTYKFHYDNRLPMPPKDCEATDLWGFYNGHYPSSSRDFWSTPSLLYLNQLFTGKNIIPSNSYMQMGILKQIEYPTGSTTNFIYEPHSFTNSITPYHLESDHIEFESSENPEYVESSEPYLLINDVKAQLTVNYAGVSVNTSEMIIVRIKVRSEYDDYYLNKKIHVFDVNIGEENGSTKSGWFNLPKGEYKIEIERENLDNIINLSCDLICYEEVRIKNGAGLRVKNITTTGQNTYSSKSYVYETNGVTNGTIMSPPLTYIRIFPLPANPPQPIVNDGVFFATSSTSYIPLSSSARGSYVGYSCVEEINYSNSRFGKVRYEYYNRLDDNNNTGTDYGYFPGCPSNPHYSSGLCLKTTYFDNMGDKQKVIENTYDIQREKIAKGLAIHSLIKNPDLEPGNSLSLEFIVKFYDLYQEKSFHKHQISKDYTNGTNGIDSIEIKHEYQYNSSNLKINNDRAQDSFGNIKETKFKYPVDYGDIFYHMIENHMVNNPIEIIELKNSQVVNANKTIYSSINNSSLPTSVYLYNSKKPSLISQYTSYYNKSLNLKYNNKKLLYERIGYDSIPITYLWGYNYLYPIAEIKNATYHEVESLLGGESYMNDLSSSIIPSEQILTNINNLRTQLPDAQITTYTYKPLVGMTSMTDLRGVKIFYEYDDFNRLKCIKDNNGNIIQKFDYHYKE